MHDPEQKNVQAPEGLADFTQQSQMILQASIDGFCIIGTDGKLLEVNPALSNISGYSRQELLNMTLEQLEAKESPHEIAEHIEKLIDQGYDRFETKHRHKTGKILDIEVSVQFCDFGKEKMFFSFFRDITNRKLIETRLTESEAIYRKAIEASDCVPYRMRLSDEKYTFIGAGIERLTGISADKFTEEQFDELIDRIVVTLPNPSQIILDCCAEFNRGNFKLFKAKLTEYHREIAQGRIKTFSADFHLHTKDGREKWIANSAVYIRDEKSDELHSLGIFQDVTERKNAEQNLKRSQAFYRTAIEVAGSVPFEMDVSERKYIFLGEGMYDMFGVKADDFTDVKFDELMHEIIVTHPNPSTELLDWIDALNKRDTQTIVAKRTAYHQAVADGRVKTYHGVIHTRSVDGREKWISDDCLYRRDKKTNKMHALGIWHDITELKTAELKLKRSETFYRRAIEAAGSVPYQFDVSERRHIFLGDGVFNILGVKAEDFTEAKFDELMQETIIIHPNPSKEVLEWIDALNQGDKRTILAKRIPYHQAVAEGRVKTYHAVIHVRSVDGREKWISDDCIYRRDEKTSKIHALGIWHDITELKTAEQNLKRSETFYRRAIEAAGSVPYEFDISNCRSIYRGEGVFDILGIKPEDYTAAKFDELMQETIVTHPNPSKEVLDLTHAFNQRDQQTIPAKRAAYHQLVADGRVKTYHAVVHLNSVDGREKWISDHSIYHRDEKTKNIHTLGIWNDITDLKIAEQALAASEKLYREAIEVADGVPYKLQISENKYTYTFVGAAIEKIFGLKIDQATEENLNELILEILPTDPNTPHSFIEYCRAFNQGNKKLAATKLTEYCRHVKANRIQTYHTDSRICTTDGREKWVSNHAIYLHDEKPGQLARFGIIQDITERKNLQAQIEIYRQRIFESQKYAYIDSLAATVAHQLNQPLTMINMLLAKAIEDLETPTPSPSHTLNDLRTVLSEAKHAASIIGQFRQHARDRDLTTHTHCQIHKVAPAVLSTLSESARQAKLSITMEPAFHLPPAAINQAALEQVFLNIIQNAIEATDGKSPHNLAIEATVHDREIRIIFADDCSGIPHDNIDRIFEPFFTTKSTGRGMGLGLEIVHRILIACGGQITAESRPAMGATFHVTLPVADHHKEKK